MAQGQKSFPYTRRRQFDSENGAMFFARLAPKRIIDLTNHPIVANSLHPGSIFEIDGPVESGKTSILVDIAAHCILGKPSGGLEVNVAFIDCDRQFHIKRLITVLQRILHGQNEQGDEKVTDSLTRFHYLACDNSAELLQSFDLLDKTLESVQLSETSGGWILLIDSINAFYWLDRTSRSRTSVIDKYQAYSFRINRFLQEHNMAAIITKLIIEAPNDHGQEPGGSTVGISPKLSASCIMDSSWRKLITKTIFLSVLDVGGKKMHKAAYHDSNVIHFSLDFNGISYI